MVGCRVSESSSQILVSSNTDTVVLVKLWLSEPLFLFQENAGIATPFMGSAVEG